MKAGSGNDELAQKSDELIEMGDIDYTCIPIDAISILPDVELALIIEQ